MPQFARERVVTGLPRTIARVAGVFYLLNIVLGIFGMFGTNRLVVSGDPQATATNILAHESFFRLCFASMMMATIFYVVITYLLYELLKPAGRGLSTLAAFFSLVGCAVSGCAEIFHLGVLVVLGGAPYLSAFPLQQLQAMAMLLLKIEARAEDVSIIFFGCYCVLIGWLIYKSGFMPRAIGLLVALSGVGWMTYLWPPLAFAISSGLPVTGLLGEGGLMACLLLAAVNQEKWNARAGLLQQ